MAKESDTVPASTKGTEAYGEVLYRLGIDVDTGYEVITTPEEVIDLKHFKSPATVDYPNLQTEEQLQALADKHKRYAVVPNEATLAARLMSQIFPFEDIPDLLSSERSSVPCQVLEFRSAFTGFDRFNESIYNYVRGPKKERDILPNAGDLRSRSDLTIMAYNTAISKRLRKYCNEYPGVHKGCDAIAPFLSIEFKVSNDSAKVKEATHQIAISSYVNLVERQRLTRPAEFPYVKDDNLRHYAYTICGTEVTVWVTTLRLEKRYSRFYQTYKVRKLQALDLADKSELQEFLQWHRHIVTWGTAVYATEYVKDLERCIGGDKRQSLAQLILSKKVVTGPVNSEGIPEGDELGDEVKNPAIGGTATEELMSEEQNIDGSVIGESAIGKLAMGELAARGLSFEGAATKDAAIKGAATEGPAIRDAVTEDAATEDAAIKDAATEDPSTGDAATKDPTIKDLAIKDQAIDGAATENPAGRGGKDKEVKYVPSSTITQNLPDHQLNEAATSSRNMANTAAVIKYLNKQIEDNRKLIKQLEDEQKGRHANVVGKGKEHALSSKVAELQAARTIGSQSRTGKSASPKESTTSTNPHGSAGKQPVSTTDRKPWRCV